MKMMELTILTFRPYERKQVIISPKHIVGLGDSRRDIGGRLYTEVSMSKEFSNSFYELMMNPKRQWGIFAVLGTPKEIVEKWNECMGYETEEKKCP